MGISAKALVSGDQLLEFIPQRAPIVMVDDFFGVADQLSVSGMRVREDNVFCIDGRLDECGIIEHVAQSAALRVGYICREQNKAIPIGFIGSVKGFQLFSFPCVGSYLKTEIRVEQEIFNITLISATIISDNQMIARCQMKIYLQQ